MEPLGHRTSGVHRFGGAYPEPKTTTSIFSGVRYRELYPGIDLLYHAVGSDLKSEFVVAPSADPGAIRIAYAGARTLEVDSAGTLVARTLAGEMFRESGLAIFQYYGAARKLISGSFRVLPGENSVGFQIGDYDHNRPLIIDPVLSFSTYLGGSMFDAATAVAVDSSGNMYLTGWTESADFPGTGSSQPNGNVDVFVAKLDPTGSRILYCTYLGGSGEDRGTAIAVDTGGNAYVTGYTTSTNFPVSALALATKSGGGRDAFVLKLSPAGDRLLYSTYLGGGGADTARAMAVDAAGNAYIAGETDSTNFPVYHAIRATSGGQLDAFITMLDPSGSVLRFSTYFGGIANDSAAAIAVDSAGAVYVTGSTWSANFPVVSALQPVTGGNQDAFIAKLVPATSSLVFSTYFGGAGGAIGQPETGNDIALDSSGNIYIAGVTSSSNFPTLTPFQASLKGSTDAFVTKLNPSASAILYSTFLGGSNMDTANSLALDAYGDACVTGYTQSPDFPTKLAVQQSHMGSLDVFVACLNNSGSSLTFSTLLGGSGSDSGNGIALSGSVVDVAGQSTSTNYPTYNPLQALNGGGYGAIVSQLSLGGLQYFPVRPCRIADTRPGAMTGAFGPPSIAAGTSRTIPLPSSSCGIPLSASAYALNVTVVPTGFLGYVTVWPSGQPQPLVSTLNSPGGAIIANSAIVPAGLNGAISMYASDPTDVVIDINGYFAPPSTSGLQFVALSPCRIVDTRVSSGKTGAFGPPTMNARTSRAFPAKSSSCGIPTSAVAYSLSITALPAAHLGFLTVWPTDQALPLASTLNALNAASMSNGVIVPAAADGSFSVYVTDATDLLIDVNGYFAPAAALKFYPVSPCRILDTRVSSGMSGAFGPPSISAKTMRSYPVPSSSCGIPASAAAYSLNVTVVPQGYLGYLTIWPAGQVIPVASTLNSWNGEIRATAAIVQAGSGGAVSVYTSDPTDLVIDINGYFAL
jgi:hypothetical protein